MEEEVLNLQLTVKEANIVLAALGELPAKASMSIIQKMQDQAAPQVAVMQPVENEEVEQ